MVYCFWFMVLYVEAYNCLLTTRSSQLKARSFLKTDSSTSCFLRGGRVVRCTWHFFSDCILLQSHLLPENKSIVPPAYRGILSPVALPIFPESSGRRNRHPPFRQWRVCRYRVCL